MEDHGGGGARGKINCLICSENVDSRGKKVVNLPREFGGRPVDAFLKICELLGVVYSEIGGDWGFQDGGGGGRNGEGNFGGDEFPLCLVCVKGFQAVLKLQRQLTEIQAKIEERISSIRGQIRETVNKIGGGGGREAVFRLKALAIHQGISSSSFTSNSATATHDSVWPLWPTQDSSSAYVSPQEVVTLPVPPTDTNTIPSTGQDDGAADDDYFEPQDGSDNDSSTSEDNPPPKRRPIHQTYSSPSSTLRHLQTSRQSISRARKTERQAEYFSPIEKNSQGQMFYDGILITPINRGGYRCGQCNASVGKAHDSISLRKTKIHIKGFHLGAYKCSLCSKNFTSNDILNQHITRHHNAQNVPCPICGKSVRDRALKLHEYSHMNASEKEAALRAGLKVPKLKKGKRNHACRICDKKFYKRGRLQRHELTHVDPEFRRDFKCPHCDKTFVYRQARDQHILRAHETLNARKRLCRICGLSVFYTDLENHIKRRHSEHLKETCRYCTRRFEPEFIARHENKCKDLTTKVPGREFGCNLCNKYFKDLKNLSCHLKRVHKSQIPAKIVKDVSIDKPGEEYLEDLNNEGIQHVEGNIYSYQLHQLEKTGMGGGGGFKCLACTETFEGRNEEDLEDMVKQHVRSKHMGNFRCNKCTKRMKTLFQVQVHMRLEHSTKSIYDCDICGRLAISEHSFKKHLWLHKNVWEVAECINTGYSFPTSFTTCDTQEILKGMGVEVNLKCGICKQSGFDKVEDLYSHRRKDHPDAPVVPFPKDPTKSGKLSKCPDGPIDCPICGKTCADKSKFEHHRYNVHGRKKEGNLTSVEEEAPAPSSYDVGGLTGTPRRSGNRKVLPGCKHCGKVLSRLGLLREHEESCGAKRAKRTKEKGFIFACEICRLRFRTKKDVRDHKSKVHKMRGQSGRKSNPEKEEEKQEKLKDEEREDGEEQNQEEEEKQKEETKKDVRAYSSKVRKRRGQSLVNSDPSTQKRNSEEETEVPSSFDGGVECETLSFNANRNVIPGCKQCGKMFSSLQEHEEKCGLMKASRTKENGYLFECDICGLPFKTKKYVGNHRRKVHKLYGPVPVTATQSEKTEPLTIKRSDESESSLESRNEDFSSPVLVGKRKKFLIVAEEDDLEDGLVELGVVKIEVDNQGEEFGDEGGFEDSSESSHDDLSSEEEEVERGGKKRKVGRDGETWSKTDLRARRSLRSRSYRNVNYVESEDEAEQESE